MKNISILLCVSVLSCVSYGAQTVTLSSSNLSVSVSPTDTIEVVSVLANSGSSSNSANYLDFTVADGSNRSTYLQFGGSSGTATSFNLTLTGLSSVSIRNTSRNDLVTIRITKQSEGFVSESLAVPLAQGTTYSVALETSTDLLVWVPANPGDYLSSSTARFFRVKAAVAPPGP